MKTSDMVVGVGLIILGILFMSENFGYLSFDFENVWPVFVLLGGIGFWIGFFQDRKNVGLLMPANILIIYGGMFLYCSLTGWEVMGTLWPLFLIGPGIGFFMMYLMGEREKGLLIPAGILAGIGLLFFLSHGGVMRYWPVILIGIGIYLVIKHYLKKQSSPPDGPAA
ncbi:MAG: hypothetical protein E4H13_06240 [Calditrichales bacterium]|nr:MAG: hypothetical protein E4H13_06240 [Calditrichales bacterium]